MRYPDEEDSFEESIRLRDGTNVVILVYTRESGTVDFILSISPPRAESVTFRETLFGGVYEGVQEARRTLIRFIEQRAMQQRPSRRQGLSGMFRGLFR